MITFKFLRAPGGQVLMLVLLQGSGDSNAGMTEQRSASLQPLIGKAVANGAPPKATRLKPSRPPPPPPTAVELDGTAVSLCPICLLSQQKCGLEYAHVKCPYFILRWAAS